MKGKLQWPPPPLPNTPGHWTGREAGYEEVEEEGGDGGGGGKVEEKI